MLLEAFCNKCLQQNNVRAVAGEGPLVYMEAKGVFKEVWHATLDGLEKRKDSNDVYSAFAIARMALKKGEVAMEGVVAEGKAQTGLKTMTL